MALSDGEILADAGELVNDIVADLPATQTHTQSRESITDARKILLRAASIIEEMLKDKVDPPTLH